MTEVFHKAARDGYLDLLREATRRDCDKQDEDGMTPVLWAAFYGNLEALRMVVSRGGNPDRCDFIGGSALHHAAANNHLNCVSFLISFGANIWSLDNDLHTPFDLAAVNGHEDVVNYLDSVINKQMTLNRKVVKKLKEKAVLDAQKRIQKYRKLQAKAMKRVEKQERMLAKDRVRMGVTSSPDLVVIPSPAGMMMTSQNKSNTLPGGKKAHEKRKYATMSSLSSGQTITSSQSEPKPYSAHVNTINRRNNKFALTGVAKKLKQKTVREQVITAYNKNQNNMDFKVGEAEVDGKRTIRSLSGLKRDAQVMYVKNGGGSISSASSMKNSSMLDAMSGSSNKEDDVISRAISEPDLYYSGSHQGADDASIFERPGFGSVAFMNRRMTSGALMSLPKEDEEEEEEEGDGEREEEEPRPSTIGINGHHSNGVVTNGQGPGLVVTNGNGNGRTSVTGSQRRIRQRRERRASLTDSIGTVGSLAARVRDLPWSQEDVDTLDDEEEESSQLELFLACAGLTEWFSAFSRQKIDLAAMMLLSDTDLKELGLPMGPRRKLMDAVVRRKQVLNNPGHVIDTHL